MARAPEVTAIESLLLAPSSEDRRTAEQFLASFDLNDVPTASGCYIMHDEKDQVVYVGKANNLRTRVRAYINETDSRYMVKFLMRRVARIEFLITTNEKEALLLENSLIKQYKPRYNAQLRDDKTYVSVKINVAHPYPRVTITRKIRKDGSRYFGPHSSAGSARETVKQLQRVFPLRLCSDSVLNNRTRPCLYYQMKQCCAPCVDLVAPRDYRELVDQIVMVFDGKSADVEKRLLARIREHADALEFEKAAALRDRLQSLRETLERQRTVRITDGTDQDVFGYYSEGRFTEIQVLYFRGGKMLGGRSYSFNQLETPIEEVFSSFLLQYYGKASQVPSEILVPVAFDGMDALAEILAEERNGKVLVHWPQRGDKRALVDLAARNAKGSFEEKRLAERAKRDMLHQLHEKLRLRNVPNRIECFDISTIQGASPVGSMVVFEEGLPIKSRYRRYSIKQVEGQDDFAMMREMLMRRFTRAVEERDLPDLVLIDGGKGQLNVAVTVFRDLGIEDQEVIGIAKARTLDEGGRSPERFFVPGRKDPIILPQNSPVVLFLARVRDETHRFAVTYHRKRRSKSTLRTPLLDIPGVGAKRARLLLNRLGSLANVRKAAVEELAALPGFSPELAETIKRHLGASPNAKA